MSSAHGRFAPGWSFDERRCLVCAEDAGLTIRARRSGRFYSICQRCLPGTEPEYEVVPREEAENLIAVQTVLES